MATRGVSDGFGGRLKRAIDAGHATKNQLKEAGVHNLDLMIRGDRGASDETLRKLATLLKVPFDWLKNGGPDPFDKPASQPPPIKPPALRGQKSYQSGVVRKGPKAAADLETDPFPERAFVIVSLADRLDPSTVVVLRSRKGPQYAGFSKQDWALEARKIQREMQEVQGFFDGVELSEPDESEQPPARGSGGATVAKARAKRAN